MNLLFVYKNLSNEEQVVVIHARTVLTLAEKVTALPNRSQNSGKYGAWMLLFTDAESFVQTQQY